MITIRLLGPEPYRRGYGTDAEGRPWATFSSMGAARPCDICGEWIYHGWYRPVIEGQGQGADVPAMHVCAHHVNVYRALMLSDGTEAHIADTASLMGYTREELAAMYDELMRHTREETETEPGEE